MKPNGTPFFFLPRPYTRSIVSPPLVAKAVTLTGRVVTWLAIVGGLLWVVTLDIMFFGKFVLFAAEVQ